MRGIDAVANLGSGVSRNQTGPLVVFTDVDTTLLCDAIQAFDDVRPAIVQLERAAVPLVLCTERNRAQIEPLRWRLESDAPFVVENGAAVFIPNDYFSPALVLAGGQREEEYTVYQLGAVARPARGWSRGDRFHRVSADKGIAVRLLAKLYRSQLGEVTTVGIGQGPGDADLLSVVDIPIVLSSPHAPALRRLVPNTRETSFPGPRGWNTAILELLGASE